MHPRPAGETAPGRGASFGGGESTGVTHGVVRFVRSVKLEEELPAGATGTVPSPIFVPTSSPPRPIHPLLPARPAVGPARRWAGAKGERCGASGAAGRLELGT